MAKSNRPAAPGEASCNAKFLSLPGLMTLAILLTGVTGGSTQTHRVRVGDAESLAALLKRGASVRADYGSFQIVETSQSPADATQIPGVESAEAMSVIRFNSGDLNTRLPEEQARRRAVGTFPGRRLHLVQFIGPVKPEWHAQLEATGARIVDFVPENTYVIRGDAAALTKVQAWAADSGVVAWDGEYRAEMKVDSGGLIGAARPPTDGVQTCAIQMVKDEDANATALALIRQLNTSTELRQFSALGFLNIIADLPIAQIPTIAAHSDVISIQPYTDPQPQDESQCMIVAGQLTGTTPTGPGYLAWLASKGFTQAQFNASGFAVDLSDTGLDNATLTPGHFGLYEAGNPQLASRVAYARLEGTPNSGSSVTGCDGHGTLNAHILAGFNDRADGFPHTDTNGFHYGLGVCPFVRLGSSVIFDPRSYTRPNLADLQSRSWRDGARISNNSWGSSNNRYTADTQLFDALVRDAQPAGAAVAADGNQEMVIVFSAGNSGTAPNTVGAPATAKNVLSVGATENVRSFATANGGNSSNGNDGCNHPDTEANSASDLAAFSSRGPCQDGRVKPDLVAPGVHVSGGVAQASTATNGNGSALGCYNAERVCALPGKGSVGDAENFFPLGQQFYSVSSGTSHAAPAVAGACALLRQDFLNQGRLPPSPAMTKAFLMNAARYLAGVGANDTLPSNAQGFGAVNLGLALDGSARILHDQWSVEKFTASGQSLSLTGKVVSTALPFRVTLAWTDAPGSTTGAAYRNNLDLTVIVGGNNYRGNVFNGAVSVPGGVSDTRNNVESVFRPAGASGDFVVTVTAANINSDGVPNQTPALDQDFALVIYNATETVAPATLSPASVAANGQVSFAVNGKPGYRWAVQSTEDLTNWTGLATNIAPFNFTTATHAAPARRFYRAQFVP